MYIKTDFNVFEKLLLTLLCLPISTIGISQTVECFDNVEVDLFGQCDSTLTYDLFLESTDVPQDSFSLEILGNGNNSVNTVTLNQIDESLLIYVIHVESGNMCWGILDVINSQPFGLNCSNKTVYCHEAAIAGPEFTGYPQLINGCYPDSTYTFDYFDNTANLDCPDDFAFTINRLWTVTDESGSVSSCNQVINGEWLSTFDIDFPADYDDVVNPAFTCNDSMTFEMQTDTAITGVPMAFGRHLDDFYCELSATYLDIIVPGCGVSREIKRNWTIVNSCDNQTMTHQQTILYQDAFAPAFFVPDTLHASTSENCSSNFNLPPAIIEFECSDFEVEIVTPWETFNTNGGLFEFPPIPGDHIITYTLTDDCDNELSKAVIFKVRQAENLSCPNDTTITCKRYFDVYENNLSNGNFAILGNLGEPETDLNCYFNFQDSAVVDVTSCGIGTITHLMSSDDGGSPMNCVQTITVEHLSDFAVEFPADMTLTCDSGPDGYGQPIIYGDNCENIEIAYTDQIFEIVPDACYRIVRQWTVFNTCNSHSDTLNLTVESSELELGQNFTDCDLNEDGTCNERTFQDGLTADNYPNPNPDGVIVYQQVIEIIDDSAPVFVNGCDIPNVCVDTNSCVATIILPEPELSECDYRDTWAVSSALGQGFGPFSNVSVGTVSVTYFAMDACGNSTSCQTILTVEDCTAPVANCYPELLVQLTEANNCEITVNATDVNDSSLDNCLGNLVFSFSADSLVSQITFTQSDASSVPVEVFITDQSNNQSSCNSTITIETDNACLPPTGQPIGGVILSPEGEGICGVNIDISINNMTVTTAETACDGDYEGEVMFMGTDYVITPMKDDSIVNGVTTFDLVILRKHILGDDIINDPYKLIAADVNGSNSVSTLDLVNIRKVILNINDGFSVPDWRFIPADYVFPNPSNPWMPLFPESIQLQQLPPVLDVDFVGVKVGDLN